MLKILYTNANALTNKVSELETMVHFHKPEVIPVTEVLPKKAQTSVILAEIGLEGYIALWNSNMDNCHRGIAVYYREDVKAQLDD
jgi:exonuclease III